ncbi:hypothetical protein [Roseobacter weihaiensis]|uniref:hypothetical protein n=1 Tax=Roseobacter weihaiensis TaxID=2763262 RepID=UPI001D0B10DF|nr:hypothetical protein [Roseobacter sp. H9]
MTTTTHSADTGPKTSARKSTKDATPKERVAETAEQARDLAVEQAQRAADSAQEAANEVRDQLVRASEKAREVTEKQPLLVVGGALALGVVIGMALRNNRY